MLLKLLILAAVQDVRINQEFEGSIESQEGKVRISITVTRKELKLQKEQSVGYSGVILT